MPRRRPILLVLPLLALSGCSRAQPPAGSLASRLLAKPGFGWSHAEAPALRLHFRAGSWAAAHRREMTDDALEARQRAYRILRLPDDGRVLDVFFVETREELMRLTGRSDRGTSYPEDGVSIVVASDTWRPHLRHEVMHAVSIAHWGYAPAGDWIQEGLATYAEGRCGPYDLDTVAASLVASDRALPLATLTRDFRAQHDLIAYLQAGSLVGHLIATGGIERVRSAWQGDETALADADAAWRRALAARPAVAVRWEALRAFGCGWRGRA